MKPMNQLQSSIRYLSCIFALAVAWIFLALVPTVANAGSAYLILDAKTGNILASQNADRLNHPASLTKMMTLYLTFEALHRGKLGWNTKIRFSKHAASRPPTKLWVPAGKSITVREAVLGMIVPSANDAAAAMGEKLAGSEMAFSRMMTAKARQLGMKRTVFTNASGLPNRKQVTTARDMSTLAVALMNDFPKEYKLFSTRSFKFRGHVIRGHNNLMYRYKGMDGFKTGFTNASGFNLVSAVKNRNRRVIGVVMGGRTAHSRDAEMAALLDRYVRDASNGKRSKLLASVPSAGTALAAIADPPTPTPATRQRAEPQIASSSKEISDIIMARAVATTLKEPTGRWQIQVGASENKDAAVTLLTRLASRFKSLLADAKPVTEAVTRAGRSFYRARFSGFDSEKEARTVCNALAKYRVECFTITSRG